MKYKSRVTGSSTRNSNQLFLKLIWDLRLFKIQVKHCITKNYSERRSVYLTILEMENFV